MRRMAGAAAAVGNLASAIAVRAEEASIVAELKSGSEEAYNWLIAHYHQPIYSLVIASSPTLRMRPIPRRKSSSKYFAA